MPVETFGDLQLLVLLVTKSVLLAKLQSH